MEENGLDESADILQQRINGDVTETSAHLNDGYETTNGETPKSIPTGRLPPLELEPPRLTKKKSKSPRLPQKAENSAISSAARNGDLDGDLFKDGHQKKRKSKHRPTSAESKTSDTSETIDEEKKISNKLDVDINLSTKHKLSTRGESSSLDQTTASSIASIFTPDEPVSVRPKDPERKQVQVRADVEKSSDDERPQDKIEIPMSRNVSYASLRTYANEGLDEECETIEVIAESDPHSASYTKGLSPSILKNSSDHVTFMFQAGSRPTSATSSKHSVRIADEVTYSTDRPNSSRPKSARPRSAKRTTRPKSANGHANSNGHVGINGHNNVKLKQTTQRKVSPHMKTSVFTLVACGVFAGAAALYFSFQTKTALRSGDDDLAIKYSWYSKLFNIVGICSGVFIFFVVIVYYNVNKYGPDETS